MNGWLRWLGVSLVVLLWACAGEPQTPTPPPVQPTTPPVELPTATVSAPTPIALATSSPEQANVLPAPLYVIDDGQIQRFESDAITRTRITAETPVRSTASAVAAFDISPLDGTLAYIIERDDRSELIRSDAFGQDRTVLLSLPGVRVAAPRWSPQGATLAVRLSADPDAETSFAGGVYLIDAGSAAIAAPPAQEIASPQVFLPLVTGEDGLQLLQPDDPVDPEYLPAPRSYAPLAWSPDGSRLLLNGFFHFIPQCGLVVKHLDTGALIALTAPNGDLGTLCDRGAWRSDSAALYINLRPASLSIPEPGLWLADPDSGAVTPLIPGRSGDESLLVMAPHPGRDGRLYLFLSRTTQVPAEASYNPPLRYTMHRAVGNAAELEALRDDDAVIRSVLWSSRDDGAVVVRLERQTPTLVWLPANGGPVVPLAASGYDLHNVRWGMP